MLGLDSTDSDGIDRYPNSSLCCGGNLDAREQDVHHTLFPHLQHDLESINHTISKSVAQALGSTSAVGPVMSAAVQATK